MLPLHFPSAHALTLLDLIGDVSILAGHGMLNLESDRANWHYLGI